MDANQPYNPQPLSPQPGVPQDAPGPQSIPVQGAGSQPGVGPQLHMSRPTPRPMARSQFGQPAPVQPQPSPAVSSFAPTPTPPQQPVAQPIGAPLPGPQPPVRPSFAQFPATQPDPAPTPFTPPPAANAAGFSQPAVPDQAAKSKKFRLPFPRSKKAMIISGVALLVIVLGTGFFVMRSGSSPTGKKAAAQDANDVVSRNDDTMDLRLLVDKHLSVRPQDLKAKPKQQVNLSDGVSYMVTNIQRNFQPEKNGKLKIKEGKELIKVSLVVGNKSKEANMYFASGYFKLRNHSTGLQSSLSVAPVDVPDILKTQNIPSGQQVKGSVIFEVDKDEEVLGLVTEDSYKDYADNTDIALRSEVSFN